MSAIDAVLAVVPTDDAGAQTADRYEWQAAMATADGLAAYAQQYDGNLKNVDASQIRIVCEYHEDWLVQIASEVELVSAKHREPASGPWKNISSLVSDGGVGHLFTRWLMVDRQASARLVSNATTAPGEATDLRDCRGLLSNLESGRNLTPEQQEKLDSCIDLFCRALMMHRKNMPDGWRAAPGTRARDLTVPGDLEQAVRAFLLVFRIDANRPERSVTTHAAPSLYAQPLVIKIGQPAALSSSVWEAVLQLFRIRMRAQGTTERGGLPIVGLSAPSSSPTERVEERTVTLQDIKIAIQMGIAHPGAYAPIPQPRRLTKLGIKMAQGECADTSIERAERLKLDYSTYRRERRNSVPGGSAELQLVERILHRIADEETHKVRTATEPWGAELWAALSARLNSAPPELSRYQLDGDVSLGGISDLTARCRIWFSAHFDVDSAVATARQSRGEPE